MKPQPPTRSPYASSQVRSQARSYLAQLREERRARVHGAALQPAPGEPPLEDVQPEAPKRAAKAPPKKNGKRIGKRGVRVEVADAVAAPAAAAPKSKKKKAQKQPEPQKQPREADVSQSNAARARASAQEAKQKMRAARQAQRDATAKQRAAAARARAEHRGTRPQSASSMTQRRWVPQRSTLSPVQPKTTVMRPATTSAPLTQLRGIGDAMCRRLQQAGIDSLPALIDLPPSIIRERLGPVSALANVEGWQAQAKAILGQD